MISLAYPIPDATCVPKSVQSGICENWVRPKLDSQRERLQKTATVGFLMVLYSSSVIICLQRCHSAFPVGFIGRGTVMALLERFYDPNSGGYPGDTTRTLNGLKPWVVWNGLEHVLWLSIQLGTFGNFIIPTVTHSIIFQRGRLKPPTRMPSFCTKMYQVKDSQSGSVYTVPIPIAGVCFFFVAFRLGSFKNSVVILELCELFAIEVYTPYIPSLSFTWSTYVNNVNVKGH